ncbi:MAG: hypothetical protein UX28_C0003G0072 [Candidatus Pacebacteria bacterium GW2011_GWA1_46_10]|nr:MAG: hypothetical protein UX28_C0003G0072 [Candidatus Pacebacteria bacterium GW2011_GWA1_46_10]
MAENRLPTQKEALDQLQAKYPGCRFEVTTATLYSATGCRGQWGGAHIEVQPPKTQYFLDVFDGDKKVDSIQIRQP